MPYADITIAAIILGLLITVIVLARKLGKANERNGILERGLKQAKAQAIRAAMPAVVDVNEQRSKL